MAEFLSDDQTAVLKRTAMFSALDDAAIEEFLAGCRVLRRPVGSQICRPGESAERFFVVLEGRVKIFKLSAKGDEQILHLYGAGETFGEAAMWAKGNYPAFVDVLADATLLAVPRSTLHDAIAQSADLAMEMLAGLSAKLREFNQLIEQLSLKEVPARLAAVLLTEADKAGTHQVALKQSKRQLAAQIGTVAETLSRALAKLKASGLIEEASGRITILDRNGLECLAEEG